MPDPNARIAGALLILTALATLVAVVGRVAADADYPTLAESLYAISLKKELYGIGGAGRLLSGITLIAGAWYLAKTWIIRERLGTPLVPILFAVSGAFTVVSGACAVGLALFGPGIEVFQAVEGIIEVTASIRWVTGKIGFSAAGLALIVAARYQWTGGRHAALRRSCISNHRSCHAVHLDRLRHRRSPHQRLGAPDMVPPHWNHALHRPSGAAF